MTDFRHDACLAGSARPRNGYTRALIETAHYIRRGVVEPGSCDRSILLDDEPEVLLTERPADDDAVRVVVHAVECAQPTLAIVDENVSPYQGLVGRGWLVAWGQAHGSPGGAIMTGDDEDRFRSLNHCQSCHVKGKPEATSDDDDLPPWPTDGRGLYAPVAVLSAHAVLSSSPSFDDPNAGDPFMKTRCRKGAPREHMDDAARARYQPTLAPCP